MGFCYFNNMAVAASALGKKTAILDIDVQGASQIRDSDDLKPVTIFIAPPSTEELEKRLKGRATDSAETIGIRLENATKEMASLNMYDHVIINDKLDEAIEMVKAVILAERSRTRKNRSGSIIPEFKSNT